MKTVCFYNVMYERNFFYCFLQKSSPNKANDDSSVETKTGLLNDGIETIDLGGERYYWNKIDAGYIHVTDYPIDSLDTPKIQPNI